MDGKLRNMASLYILNGDEVLLLFRQGGRVVNNVWTGSAGGHFETFELNDARACVLRELKEELGADENDIKNLLLRYVTLRRTKDEIRQNYYFFAELRDNVSRDFISNEGVTRWFKFHELAALEMPFTASFIIKHYMKTGCKTDVVYAGVADGNKVVFTEMPAF
ncbi:MAG: NUDIX hydrolase [Lachnospiraceae bacterium]|nr:NUDIX hydrolase [Lachnospiraceae bacterium]